MTVLELDDSKFTVCPEGILVEMKSQKMFIPKKAISLLYLQDSTKLKFNQEIICTTKNNQNILIGSWINNYVKNSDDKYINESKTIKVFNFIIKNLYCIPEEIQNDTYGLYS